jgi:hypothetical protein
LTAVALAQDVKYNYDRDANFVSYKSYQWADTRRHARDPLVDQDIRRAIDSQLAQKGLQKVDSNADLQIEYLTAIDREKQLDGWTMGPRWNGMGHATTSTVEVGTLLVNFYDSSRKHLVWRGTVSKTLNISKDPDKNYKNLEKAVGKLLKHYPPKPEKSN